jgi:hypothetical protein
MIVESAHWPCCVTLRPRASHNPSYVGLHTDTSFRILLFAYAMMKSRVRRYAVTICEKRATWLSDKAGRVRERANRPTVSLDAISLVASSCGHYRGHIEQRAAHEFAVHVATQNGLAKRIQYRHPPRAQGQPGGAPERNNNPIASLFHGMRCPPASPLFASWPWPRHHAILVGTHCYHSIRAES